MEAVIILLFCISLMVCIIMDLSVLYAMIIGLCIFLIYGKLKCFTWRELIIMSLCGIKTAKNVLVVFMLIGMLTALWRASGTIAVIISYTASLIQPSYLLIMTFLLNCSVSMLMGTAFGTSATMGVICMTIASSMEINPILVGGAIISGAYFGDRCSPVSGSCLLVSELTKTNPFNNIKRMHLSALVPFIATGLIYIIIGLLFVQGTGKEMELLSIFRQEFHLHWISLFPAVIILLLSLFRVNPRISMIVSISFAFLICLFLQKIEIITILKIMFNGYHTNNEEIAHMLNGGGIISMLSVAAMVCISACYAGIFQGTGLLIRIQKKIIDLSYHITPYGAILCTSILTSAIACNQTLSIMLTHQLCHSLEKDSKELAIHLEDTAVVIPALIPWSIAVTVPLASIGAPTICLFMAFFIYLLPLWRVINSLWRGRKEIFPLSTNSNKLENIPH